MSKHPRLPHPPTGPHAVEDLGHATNPAWWTVLVLGLITAVVAITSVLILSVALGVIAAILLVVTIATGAIMMKMGMGSYTYEEGDSPSGKEAIGVK